MCDFAVFAGIFLFSYGVSCSQWVDCWQGGFWGWCVTVFVSFSFGVVFFGLFLLSLFQFCVVGCFECWVTGLISLGPVFPFSCGVVGV